MLPIISGHVKPGFNEQRHRKVDQTTAERREGQPELVYLEQCCYLWTPKAPQLEPSDYTITSIN